MSMRRHRQELRIASEINVTNLVDTAFILIIALMLVAPQLSHGLKIDLPAVAAPTPFNNPPEKTFLIGVQAKRPGDETEHIIVDGKWLSAEELYQKVQEERAKRPELIVQVDADRNCSYGTVFEVLDAVKRAGVDNVDLSSQPLLGETEKKGNERTGDKREPTK